MDYTAVGDAVNLAARFEQNAGPGQVLVTQGTYDSIADAFEVRPSAPCACAVAKVGHPATACCARFAPLSIDRKLCTIDCPRGRPSGMIGAER